jgi:hypothetical protein
MALPKFFTMAPGRPLLQLPRRLARGDVLVIAAARTPLGSLCAPPDLAHVCAHVADPLEPAVQGRGALLVAGPRAGVGPFGLQGAVEPFGLPVGPGPPGLDEPAGDAQLRAGGDPRLADPVALGVVGEHPGDGDAAGGEPGHRPGEEAGAGAGALVGQHFGVGQPGVIVDGHVHVVPAQSAAADLLGAAVHPPAAAVGHPAELLDVDVQQITGVLALVAAVAVPPAAQQLPGEPVHVGQPGQSGAGEHRPDRGRGHAQQRGQPYRPGVMLSPGGHDPRLGLRGSAPRHPMRPGGAVDQPGFALGAPAAQPFVDRLPAGTELLGHLTGPVPGQDTVDDQPAGEDGGAGISVGHRDLRLGTATSSTATPSGGLLRDQAATPTVNNVPGHDS